MLERIKEQLFQQVLPTSIGGLFLSAFDKEGKLLSSHGSVKTDKPMSTLVELLYNAFLTQQTQTHLLVMDVVQDLKETSDITEFLKLSPKEYGVLVVTWDGVKSGVLLPDTAGVVDMQSALSYLKQKYQLTGTTFVSTFKTRRSAFAV